MRLFILFLLAAGPFAQGAWPQFDPGLLPIPQEAEALPGAFTVDDSVTLALPLRPSEHDLFLAHSLSAEMAGRYGIALREERMASLPDRPVIVMGDRRNPLIQAAERKYAGQMESGWQRPEGYQLLIQPTALVVDGCDEAGAFYGFQSVRQLLALGKPKGALPGLRIRDWPSKPLRGLKVYLPGPDNIAYFKRLLSDFMALYKFNTVFVEIDGAMRFDRHPEINAGWIDLFKDLQSTRRLFPRGPHGESVDSPNQDVADGQVLEKHEVAELAAWARQQHIDFVPEMPSLTHSYYLLARHHELADPAEAGREWPDAYDADNPAARRLYFDLLDEVIDVTHPRMIHIGHDEWQTLLGTAPGTSSDDRRRQYAKDVRAIHDYLGAKGIQTAMYGDELMESVRGRGHYPHLRTATRAAYEWPGALPPEQVAAEIPKDILVFNWFWREGVEGKGEANDRRITQWGFPQVFNNFEPDITNYGRRSSPPSVLGGVPSAWAATTESNMAKDMLFDSIGCENLVWSSHWPERSELIDRVEAALPVLRQRLSGHFLPSEEGDPLREVALPPQPGVALDPAWLNPKLAVGVAGKGGTTLPRESPAIEVGADVSSLIFVQALARPAANEFAYRLIHDFDDSADLMGYYEVRYEDGLVLTIPIRYGVNILESSWGSHRPEHSYPLPTPVTYDARAIECGRPGAERVTYFAMEWPNPRLGKPIRSVRLIGSDGFSTAARNSKGMASNAVLLRSLSAVLPRPFRAPEPPGALSMPLSQLELSRSNQYYFAAPPKRTPGSHPIAIAGRKFSDGFGLWGSASLRVKLDGHAQALSAWVGMTDDSKETGPVWFEVIGDGHVLWTSRPLKKGEPALQLNLSLAGIKTLTLAVQSPDCLLAYSAWGDAAISYRGAAPVAESLPEERAEILTPRPGPGPRLTGSDTTGVRPGHPLLYKIAATGERPLTYAADPLPAGVVLDPATGILTGAVGQSGEYRVRVSVRNRIGTAARILRIVVGDRIALTPPMGWNSWNAFGDTVTEEAMKRAADAIVSTGLIDHGWTYVDIDDFWMTRPRPHDPVVQMLDARVKARGGSGFKFPPNPDPRLLGPARDASGAINPNQRFPDMAALTDHIHRLGLKAGLYSSPGPLTCGRCTGSYQHEALDAARFAAWGFDLLKYDWCSYVLYLKDDSVEEWSKPGSIMGAALRAQPRDLVFSLSNDGKGQAWTWGAKVAANTWRTTDDIRDSWASISGIGFSQNGHETYAEPGRWNDTDMLVVGLVGGWGPERHSTHLTPNEQYSHITLWSLLASPLLIGCDLTQLDDFTLGLLTNDEVLAVDQDSLGRPARRIRRDGDLEVWARPLSDGSIAVGLFNRGEVGGRVSVSWADLGLAGPRAVRDVWRQKEVGKFEGDFAANVPRHGVVLVKFSPAGSEPPR